MRPHEPFCEFCRHTDGSFNYDEWHALQYGWFTPYFMWPFLLKHCTEARQLLSLETHYVLGGMLLHYFTVLLPSVILLVGVC